MRQDHPELLTTLRDVAATAVTFLDAFAQIRRERTSPPAASPPPTGPDEPTDAPAPQVDLYDTPDASADPPDTAHPIFLHPIDPIDPDPEMTPLEAVHRRIMENRHRTSARENAVLQHWAAARDLADSINDSLFEIAEMASAAIEGDALRTLPILDAILERLRDEFSDRTGPFAVAPDIELVR